MLSARAAAWRAAFARFMGRRTTLPPHLRERLTDLPDIGGCGRPALLATAVFYGEVRLIDHVRLVP